MDAPFSAPTLVPTRAAGGSTPASKSACRTPTWAAPLAPPPPSTHVRRADPNIAPTLRPFLPRREVAPLLLGEDVDDDAHRVQLQPGDLRVDLVRDVVHPVLQLCRVILDVLGPQRLVREAH